MAAIEAVDDAPTAVANPPAPRQGSPATTRPADARRSSRRGHVCRVASRERHSRSVGTATALASAATPAAPGKPSQTPPPGSDRPARPARPQARRAHWKPTHAGSADAASGDQRLHSTPPRCRPRRPPPASAFHVEQPSRPLQASHDRSPTAIDQGVRVFHVERNQSRLPAPHGTRQQVNRPTTGQTGVTSGKRRVPTSRRRQGVRPRSECRQASAGRPAQRGLAVMTGRQLCHPAARARVGRPLGSPQRR